MGVSGRGERPPTIWVGGDLLGGTITGVTVDGDDTIERDHNGNPVTTLGALTVDFADGAQITVAVAATP